MFTSSLFNIFRKNQEPSTKEILEVKNSKPGYVGFIERSKIDHSYHFLLGEKKEFPLTLTTPKDIHHGSALSMIKIIVDISKDKTNSTIKKLSILILTCIGFTFLAFYLHNYLLLIGSTTSILAGSYVSNSYILNPFIMPIAIKKYEEEIKKNLSRIEDDPKKQNALVLMPMIFCDKTAAFIRMLITILGPIAKKYNIDLYYPLSVEHIKGLLLEKKYDHLLICGHGQSDLIEFTHNFSLTTPDISKLNFSKLSKQAAIALNSCSTGAMGGIAEKIALVARRKVFAPHSPSYRTFIEVSDDGSIKYKFTHPRVYLEDKDGNFIFDLPFFMKDITRIIAPNEVTNIPKQHKPCFAKT